jgi:cytochrome c oxidase subunit 1
MRRLLGFNLLTGLALGVLGFVLGGWLGRQVSASSLDYVQQTGQNDLALFIAYLAALVGFLAGLGALNYPVARMLGRTPAPEEREYDGWERYLSFCTDHKVIGRQYLIGIGAFLFIGGLNAMLIRVELLRPEPNVWPPGQYLTLVGLHGTMMMGIMTSGIIGPFGNFFVPLMIGTRRMAYPRLEALSFWLLMAAGVLLMSSIFLGGFPTGWTGYVPLANQANLGMDAYILFFALVGVSMTMLGLNQLATIVSHRAPGMTWSRLPIFVWAVLATSGLLVLAAPVLIGTLFMLALDRTAQTSFFLDGAGGSSYLFENLFWFFGHPEVYILAIPGFGIVLELLPVFTRRPLWGYRMAVAGMCGVALLSFFVWQHHLFVSGINSDLRPFFILATELISVPTAFTFLCFMGTLWLARIRFTVPMLFCLAWGFNFLIGGLTGVYLSDAPSDVTTHGTFFSMAHFHYTIMGGLVFMFFAAIYYWFPKMFGLELRERLGKIHFWLMFVSFNSTFGPLFAVGLLGQPRRVVTYPENLQFLNVWVSVSAFVLGASMLVFLANLVWSLVVARRPAAANPWDSRSLEWQVPTPVPVYNFERIPEIDPDPYPYGTGALRPTATPAPSGGALP